MPQWFQLKMPCPVTGCPNSERVIKKWICSDDKTTIYVSEEGRLSCCSTYNNHNNRILNWKFDCGDRTGPHRSTHFQQPDPTGFSHAMSVVVGHASEAGADWIKKLVKEVTKQAEELKN